MMAMATSKATAQDQVAEGVIDLFAGVWVCTEHHTRMRAGHQCSFCAVEAHGIEVLDVLAQ